MAELTTQQACELAQQLQRAGRLGEAEAIYRQVLSLQPDHAECLHSLGLLTYEAGRASEAEGLLRKAVELNPESAAYLANLGSILAGQNRLDEAIVAFSRSLRLRPDAARTCRNLAEALAQAGRLDEALDAARRAVVLEPNSVDAQLTLGNVLCARQRGDEAIPVYRCAIAISPTSPAAHNGLGLALRGSGDVQSAIAAFRQAIALRPDFFEAHNNLGIAFQEAGQLDEAIAACRRALALHPQSPEAHVNLGNALRDAGELDQALASYRTAAAIKDDAATADSVLFTIHFHPDYDRDRIYQEHAAWNRRFAEPLARAVHPHANDRSPDRRLRIGYVSHFLGNHTVGRFLLPILAHHDKRGVEVYCYHDACGADSFTEQLRSFPDAWKPMQGVSDDRAAALVREDRIDLLIDLTMHTHPNRLLMFARKPAPVQLTYLAYCSTTGLATMDYRLTDPYLDPPDRIDRCYSEKSVRLPHTYWCYSPPPEAPAVASPPALGAGCITFGCLNSFSKVTSGAIAAWGRILRQVADSRLIVHSKQGSHRQRVREQLAGHGIEPQRIEFVEYLPLGGYFEQFHRIDIALDTFPYAGGTSTCDALWMGVPVVSLAGQTAVSRGGLSILSNVGLTELVARTQDEYEQIAVVLTRDLPRLRGLREAMRARLGSSPLMDAITFVRDLEAVYRQMWVSWCQS